MRRILLVLATAVLALFGAGGVASANSPVLIVGSDFRSIGNGHQCVGLILDGDGVYNVPKPGGTGYDALVCTGGYSQQLGWNHVAGYYIGPGACEQEHDEFDTYMRTVCAPNSIGTNRFASYNLTSYKIHRSK